LKRKFREDFHMKCSNIRTMALVGHIFSLFALCACDSGITIVEAFLPNDTETKLFTYTSSGFRLGQSVAIRNDVALIGSSSSTFIYRWDGNVWMKQANLIRVSGRSAGLSENIAAIGRSFSRSVSVYRSNGLQWQEEAIVTPGDEAPASGFGYAVSISGEVIVVGDNSDSWFRPDYGNASPRAGVVYIYRFNGSKWVEEARLNAEAPGFGYAVSVSGNVVIVGAWGVDGRADDTGIAYVYRFTGSHWQQEAELTANDAAQGDLFGRAVAISGDVAIVGAPYDDESMEDAGSAYIFRYDGSSWHEEAKLSFRGTASATSAYFGSAVAVDEDIAIIGAPFYDDAPHADISSLPGAAYVYRWDGSAWREHKVLAASDGTAGNGYGWAVSISGRLAIVGAPRQDFVDVNNNYGAAYVYVLD
jgi:hypothetical protein